MYRGSSLDVLKI